MNYILNQLIKKSSIQFLSWKCSECSLIWKASPRERSGGIVECPYYSGEKAIPGITSFKALYPDLMIEWKRCE
jgi:hypothetical protein